MDIIDGDQDHQAHQQQESNGIDRVLNVFIQLLAPDLLEDQEHEPAAIQRRDREKIQHTQVDRQQDDQAAHIAEGGQDAFLNTLKPGVYTIKVTDGDTTATATYRVAAGGITESVVLSATTGDPGVALYASLAVSAALGLGYVGKRKED